MVRHNELRDGVADLSGKYFTPSHLRNDPLIFTGCAVKSPKANLDSSKATTVTTTMPQLETTEQKGDLLICDLWKNGTNSVQDMHVVNAYAKSHLAKTPEKCLQEADRAKKKMYLEAFLQLRQHFSLFIAFINGLMGVEAMAALKMIASRLATKWQQPYSVTCGYVKSRVTITLVRATHRCIQGYRVPAHKISVQRP